MHHYPVIKRWTLLLFIFRIGMVALSVFTCPALAASFENATLSGSLIMEEVFKRHEQSAYVYEEQTMVLTDSAGKKDVRQTRRFSRVETDRTVKYLLIFDNPIEVRGVALRVIRSPEGKIESGIYLPAIGTVVATGHKKGGNRYFMGTDFELEDLMEMVLVFDYTREADQKIAKIDHFVIKAVSKQKKGNRMHRHFIRKDNHYIVRTDYFDHRGKRFKQLTQHDLNKVNSKMWRANMLLMENEKQYHKTLIKINRRVFSHDYVPSKMFNISWLENNHHIMTDKPIVSKQLEKSDPPF